MTGSDNNESSLAMEERASLSEIQASINEVTNNTRDQNAFLARVLLDVPTEKVNELLNALNSYALDTRRNQQCLTYDLLESHQNRHVKDKLLKFQILGRWPNQQIYESYMLGPDLAKFAYHLISNRLIDGIGCITMLVKLNGTHDQYLQLQQIHDHKKDASMIKEPYYVFTRERLVKKEHDARTVCDQMCEYADLVKEKDPNCRFYEIYRPIRFKGTETILEIAFWLSEERYLEYLKSPIIVKYQEKCMYFDYNHKPDFWLLQPDGLLPELTTKELTSA